MNLLRSEETPSSRGALRGGQVIRGGRGLDVIAGLVVASCLSALCLVLADRWFRPAWDFEWTDHWKGAPVLYLAPAALVGLLWANVRLLGRRVSVRLGIPRGNDWGYAGFVGLLAAGGIQPLAEGAFSGARISETWLGESGPLLAQVGVFVAVTVSSFLVWRAKRMVARGRMRPPTILSGAFLSLGCVLCWMDLSFYVGLYEDIHTFLEICAFSSFLCGFQLLGFVLVQRFSGLIIASRVSAGFVLSLGLSFVAFPSLRTWTDQQLAHAWVDQIYVGRALRRTQEVEISLNGGGSFQMARVDQLGRKFSLVEPHLAGKWIEPSELTHSYPGVKNIVFFYVDTLRADVARDPSLMPYLAEFRKTGLDFTRAYAPGSDTLRSLPSITSGNYFLDKTHPGDLLRLARTAGHKTTLIAAKSATEFLAKLLPAFAFEETEHVADYEEGEAVWGYGAHHPTASGVTDQAVRFLASERATNPFFLWLLHFDAHAWREIDDHYIETARSRFEIPEQGELSVRYRVIARTLDEQFGRLLSALEMFGRSQDTAVVFLSDHGEGLGQGGFWVHSIFLWETLVHVPLVMHIPGVLPKRITSPVSLVDVAPTLAPILGGSSAVYHGQALPPSQDRARRFPILLRGGQFQGLERIGILDEGRRRKLIVRLKAARPELYAYESDRRDRFNLARQESQTVAALMQILATSPVFPRSDDDFVLHPHPDELSDGILVSNAVP